MKTAIKLLQQPLTWFVLVLCLITFFLLEIYRLRKEGKRLSWNQEVIVKNQQEIRLSNGRMATQNGVLTLRVQELKALYPRLSQDIKALDIPARQVQSLSQVGFSQNKGFRTPLMDSISANATAQNTSINDSNNYKIFHYKDAYYTVDGIANLGQQWVNISNQDTLMQVVYQHRKHKWLWIFSPRILEQRLQFKNPNAHIYYSQNIQISK